MDHVRRTAVESGCETTQLGRLVILSMIVLPVCAVKLLTFGHCDRQDS